MDRYLLTITLDDMPYDCWRQLLVPANLQLDALHLVLQHVMGWENCHLYLFSFGNKTYCVDTSVGKDTTSVTLEKALGKRASFAYEHDFRDSCMHSIQVQKVEDDFQPGKLLYCIDGKGNCPPEDCGGVWGFQEMLETISDPENEEFAEMRDWADMGDDEDVASRWPGKFPLAATNKWLAKLKLN